MGVGKSSVDVYPLGDHQLLDNVVQTKMRKTDCISQASRGVQSSDIRRLLPGYFATERTALTYSVVSQIR